MKIAIHQPEHLPWLGFFHKIRMADVYVVLDNVQYTRRYFHNRNKIRTKQGWLWLTVPVEKENRDDLIIKETKIFQEDLKWKNKNLESIYHNYRKAEYFKNYWDDLYHIYNKEYTYLLELNLSLLKLIFEKLRIKKEIQLASDLNVSGNKGDLIFNICKSLGATTYISGISGRDYLDFNKFQKEGIDVVIQEFYHPIYKQLYEPFIPCLSIIDLLFNHGDKSLDIINGKNVAVMDELFL